MTARRALVGYLAAVHLAVAVGGVLLLLEHHRPWILGLEAGVLVSAGVAWSVVRSLTTPEELIRIGSEWMKEGDFSHGFSVSGTRDLRQLVELFNAMLTQLREERIRTQEQDIFLHKLLDASPSGTLTTDHDGRVDLVNRAAARLLEVAPESLRGRRLEEVETPLVRQLAEVPLGEPRLVGQRGRRRLRVTRSRFFDRGFPRHFLVVEDLTHELWASEKQAYNRLIRTLSHEVNNTLGATSSILQSVLAFRNQLRPDDREDFSSALEVAIARAGRLTTFMRRYAEVARVPEPLKRPADLVELLQGIVRLMDAECRRRSVELRLEVAEPPPLVALDVAQVEQVLVNVVRNALEAIGQDGTIAIRVDRAQGDARVTVSDSGPGLDPEARANLFTPFYSSKPDGQGVGLTLAQEILNLHGCDFSLDSPPGGPTRFTVMFGR